MSDAANTDCESMPDDIHFDAPVTQSRTLRDVVVRTGFVVVAGCLELENVLIAPEVGDIKVDGGELRLNRVHLSATVHVQGGQFTATDTTWRGGARLVVDGGGAHLESCSLEGSADPVVQVRRDARVQLLGCEFSNRTTAVVVSDIAGLEARDCTFAGQEFGVRLDTAVAAWIDACRFHQVGTGVHLRKDAKHQVTANQFRGCDICIDVHDVASPNLLGNEFHEATRSGVETHERAAPYLEGNLFQENQGFAIRALDSSKPVLAANGFVRNGGRLHMDSNANPVRLAEVVEWSGRSAYVASVQSMASAPAIVPRRPLSQPARVRALHQARWLAIATCLLGFLPALPLAFGWTTPIPMTIAGIAMLPLLAVVLMTLLIRRDRRRLTRGWLAQGEVTSAEAVLARVRFLDHHAEPRERWTWMPRAHVGQTVDVLYDAANSRMFLAIPRGGASFAQDQEGVDNRRLVLPPGAGAEIHQLSAVLWDGPRQTGTALQKPSGGLLDRFRALRERVQTAPDPVALGELTLRHGVLAVLGARLDLQKPFTLTATSRTINNDEAEVYLQISGCAPRGDDRVTAGVRTRLPQDRISRNVPTLSQSWPWVEPADFESIYAALVHLARIHGAVPPAISTSPT